MATIRNSCCVLFLQTLLLIETNGKCLEYLAFVLFADTLSFLGLDWIFFDTAQCSSGTQTDSTFSICEIFETVTNQPSWMDTTVSDICQTWNSSYITCSGTDIVQINLNSLSINISGTLNLDNGNNKWPTTLTDLELDDNSLSGNFYLLSFNESSNIDQISIKDNFFSGTIDWDSLQATSLRFLWLQDNQFSGMCFLFIVFWLCVAVCVKCCHGQLINCYVCWLLCFHIHTGTIDATNLPDTLDGLGASRNKFNKIITEGFSDKHNLGELYIHRNNLVEEDINFADFTNTLQYLYMSHNNISGTIANLPNNLLEFYGDNCLLTGMIWDNDTFGNEIHTFGVTNNDITSDIDMSILPASIKYFYGQNNDFSGTVDLSYLTSGIVDFAMSGNPNLVGPLDFTNLPDSGLNIEFDVTVHCDPFIYCGHQCAETFDRSAVWCDGKTSCEATCGACGNGTCVPTSIPTEPSITPTYAPSNPTNMPTKVPTQMPVNEPTAIPSVSPSTMPTNPTLYPSIIPTSPPSTNPSQMPSSMPSEPTSTPTRLPSIEPSSEPS